MGTNNKIAHILAILFIGGIGVQTFTACGNSDPKLLESITDENGVVQERFEYDDKNRLVKIYEYGNGVLFNVKTITYSDDDLVTVGNVEFTKKGNTITSESDTLTINGDGFIIKSSKLKRSKPSTYEYKGGNLKHSPPLEDYAYDDKKSRFSNTNTPKWLVQFLFGYESASKNNVRRAVLILNDYDYEYEYDEDGFPIKETALRNTSGKIDTTITHYAYCIKTQCHSAADIIEEEELAAFAAQKERFAIEAEQAAAEAVGTLTDKRDGKVYKTIKMPDGKTWMAENLNYQPKEKAWCYENKPTNCKTYGRLYYYYLESAVKACPPGWHLPSLEEWENLAQATGSESDEDGEGVRYWVGLGKKLKAKSGWSSKDGGDGTDDYGFSALPGGNRVPQTYIDDGSTEFFSGAWWWSSAPEDDGNYAPRFSIDGDNLKLFTMGRVDEANSVRCVKDN